MRDAVARRVGEDHYQRYFDGQSRVQRGEHGLEVVVPTETVARLLGRRFGEELRQVSVEVAGGGELTFRVDRGAFGVVARGAERGSRAASRGGRLARGVAGDDSARFDLDVFLVGASNRLAHAAAVRVAEDPEFRGTMFLHGACGLGKTHLLRGIARRFARARADGAVKYTTAEAFTNEYVSAVRAGKLEAFRRVYRRLELLCLDDVHFLTNKESTQRELLHTFDAIGLEGSRVVMASDEHPREIEKLSSHLVSRFMSGAVVRIEAPDAELRERLIRHLAGRRGMELEDSAVRLVAERSARSIGLLGEHGGSVREIDGLLVQIEAVQRLLPEYAVAGSIGVILVRKAFELGEGGASMARVSRPIPLDLLIGEVCRCLSVDRGEFAGTGRHKRVVLARGVSAVLARRLTTQSFPEIARAMGRPNHSTIITACKRLEAEMASGQPRTFEDEVRVGILGELQALGLAALIDAIGERVVRAARESWRGGR